MCVPTLNLKWSDPLPETHLFFIFSRMQQIRMVDIKLHHLVVLSEDFSYWLC